MYQVRWFPLLVLPEIEIGADFTLAVKVFSQSVMQ